MTMNLIMLYYLTPMEILFVLFKYNLTAQQSVPSTLLL